MEEKGRTIETENRIENAREIAAAGLSLIMEEGRLTLTDGNLSMAADFGSMTSRLKHNNLSHEMLVKAAKIKEKKEKLTAVDATAGLGEDSILLAAAGFEVELCEYNAVIAALLEDALRRAREDEHDPKLAEIASRMHVHNCDSIEYMRELAARIEAGEQERPDVIFLDPMFPAREKSALIKKKFQLLQKLESPCSEESDLLEAARAAKPHKLVIKRPLKGPYLAGVKPDYSLEGKAIRYDCIVTA